MVSYKTGRFFSSWTSFFKKVVSDNPCITTVSVIADELATLPGAKINRLLLQKMATQQSTAKPRNREFQTENVKGHACRGNGVCRKAKSDALVYVKIRALCEKDYLLTHLPELCMSFVASRGNSKYCPKAGSLLLLMWTQGDSSSQ